MAYELVFFIVFLCWGSFLNVLGYRLVRGMEPIVTRSHCPTCKHPLRWYDLIPLFSWLFYRGRCQYCSSHISLLYPLIELLTATLLSLLLIYLPTYFFPYAFFISALIVTIRSDLESMLVSRFVSLYLMPIGWLLSYFDLLRISLHESILASVIAFSFLSIVRITFSVLTKKQGIGQGDIDLFAFIGSFIGFIGCWFTLLFASFTGTMLGIMYLAYAQKTFNSRIPFAPFLASGAIVYLFFSEIIQQTVFTT